MFKRLYRQRRRLLVTGVIGAMTGLAASAAGLGTGTREMLATGAGAGLAFAAFFVIALPVLRQAAESVALAALILVSLAAICPPAMGWASHIPLWGIVLMTVFVGVLIGLAAYVVCLGAFPLPFPISSRSQIDLRLPRSEVWRLVDPRPGSNQLYWNPTVVDIRPVPGNPDDVALVYRGTDSEEPVIVRMTIRDAEEGRSYGYLQHRPKNLDFADELETGGVLNLEDVGHGTRVTIVEVTRNVPVMLAVMMWLDDWLGDHLDHMAAVIEGRSDRSIHRAMMMLAA